jgi:hypothetical protein
MRWLETRLALASLATGCILDWSTPAGETTTGGPGPTTSTSGTTGEPGTSAAPSSDASSTTTQSSSGDGTSSTTRAAPTMQQGNWLRSAAILTSGTASRAAEEVARFDLLVTTLAYDQAWSGGTGNSWSTLAELNPELRILVAFRGPGMYRTNSGLGAGWDFIAQNHGPGANRWAGVGETNPTAMLRNGQNLADRAMWIGADGWAEYYVQALYDALSAHEVDGVQHLDGVFLQLTQYRVPAYATWEAETSPGVWEPDFHGDYYENGHDHDRWQMELDAFLDFAIPDLEGRANPLTIALDFANLEDPQWADLVARTEPVRLAVPNTGVVRSGGGTVIPEYFVTALDEQLARIGDLGDTGFVAFNEGRSADIAGSGLTKMGSPETTNAGGSSTEPLTGWQALWFAMCMHMASIDTTRDDILLRRVRSGEDPPRRRGRRHVRARRSDHARVRGRLGRGQPHQRSDQRERPPGNGTRDRPRQLPRPRQCATRGRADARRASGRDPARRRGDPRQRVAVITRAGRASAAAAAGTIDRSRPRVPTCAGCRRCVRAGAGGSWPRTGRVRTGALP